MEPIAAQTVYAELNTIKATLQKLEHEIEWLATLVVTDAKPLNSTDYLSIVGLGASGLSDVARAHDRYVGESIADEHLH